MKYKRILLKLSGESLQGSQKYGLSPEVLQSYAEQIRAAAATGVQIGIVIGGGNIFRGLTGAKKGFDRVKGDQMVVHSVRLDLIGIVAVNASCQLGIFDVLLKVRRHNNKVSALLLRLPHCIAGFYPKGFCGVVFGENNTVSFFYRTTDCDRILLQNRVEHTLNRRIKVVHIAMQY